MPPSRPDLVLASGSPRRREMLATLGLTFAVRPVDVDETPLPGERAEPYVRRVAAAKAAATGEAGELVLAADTTVVLDGELLGKPADPAAARAMLASLAGRAHEVLTALALREPATGRTAQTVERTVVRIGDLSRDEIDWYIATGEPLDKAGAYGIQGLGTTFVESLDGSYTNVVGLPLSALRHLLAGMGHDWRSWRVDGGPARP